MFDRVEYPHPPASDYVMARIRSIHPGLFTDESFMALTVSAPLAIPLLLGLWTEADDAGTFEWKPLTIKARILPAASTDVNELLRELMAVGVIQHFRMDGKDYGVIRNFVKFQRPKDPKDTHPHSEETRAFAGFTSEGKRPNPTSGRKPFGTTSEPLPKSFGTTSEISAQMEDVGCRRDSNSEIVANHQDTSAPRKAKRDEVLEILTDCVSAQTATEIVAHRKAKKSPLTAGAARRLVKAWRRFGDCEAAASAMLARGWTGFEPDWMQQQSARAGPPQRTDRNGFGQIAAELFGEGGLNGKPKEDYHQIDGWVSVDHERIGYDGVGVDGVDNRDDVGVFGRDISGSLPKSG